MVLSNSEITNLQDEANWLYQVDTDVHSDADVGDADIDVEMDRR